MENRYKYNYDKFFDFRPWISDNESGNEYFDLSGASELLNKQDKEIKKLKDQIQQLSTVKDIINECKPAFCTLAGRNCEYIKLEHFKEHFGVTIEDFIEIITHGFYYKGEKGIYYCNNAIFVGNGYSPHSNSMVRTHYLINDADKAANNNEDCHYWDWKKSEDVFDFCDYGKTWALNRDDLEEK